MISCTTTTTGKNDSRRPVFAKIRTVSEVSQKLEPGAVAYFALVYYTLGYIV